MGDYTVTAGTGWRQQNLEREEALSLAEQTWLEWAALPGARVLIKVWYNPTGELVKTFGEQGTPDTKE